MPPAGFEPTISAGERPQTYALDRAATGIGNCNTVVLYYYDLMEPPSYMRSVVDRNVVMRRTSVTVSVTVSKLFENLRILSVVVM